MSDAPPEPPPPPPAAAKFRLKPRAFVVDNVPASTPSTFEPTDVRDHFRAATAAPASGSVPPAPAPATNDIHAHLRTNLAAEAAAGLHAVKPVVPRPSRRRRDYVIVALAVNLPILGVAAYFRQSPVVLVCALAGFVMFNLRLAWSMWVVMDDY